VVVAVAAAALFLFVAVNAHAFSANWPCSAWPSGTRCYEPSGQYVGWTNVTVSYSGAGTLANICAKGVTAAGNERTSVYGPCSYNATYHQSCWGNPSPYSRAYVYWGYSSNSHSLYGHSDSDVACV
jgi:hypothetical protein